MVDPMGAALLRRTEARGREHPHPLDPRRTTSVVTIHHSGVDPRTGLWGRGGGGGGARPPRRSAGGRGSWGREPGARGRGPRLRWVSKSLLTQPFVIVTNASSRVPADQGGGPAVAGENTHHRRPAIVVESMSASAAVAMVVRAAAVTRTSPLSIEPVVIDRGPR